MTTKPSVKATLRELPMRTARAFVHALEADRARLWWMLWLFVAALIVRVHWNTEVHPLHEFLYSDMRGYAQRADQILDKPYATQEYSAFFPFGTAWIVAAAKWGFGRHDWQSIGKLFALMGALIVPMCYSIADRTMGERVGWVAPVVGLVMVVYYPLIGIGSYVLSELPFAFFLTAALFFLVRLMDEGKHADAWMVGIMLGIGTTVRSQMTASIALFGLAWLITRILPWRAKAEQRIWPKLTWAKMIQVGIPLALILGASAVRFHLHTGRYGLVSENSGINLVFGRCHNKGIYSRPDGQGHGTVRFAPPPLIQLEVYSRDNPDSWLNMDPVFGDFPDPPPDVPGFRLDNLGCAKRGCILEGGEVEYQGYIGDQELQRRLVKHCIEVGGWGRQVKYSAQHLVMLWKYTQMWPDQANPRPHPKDKNEGWKALGELWAKLHRWFLMVPALCSLLFAFAPRRRPKEAVVAINLWALLFVAAIWLGEVRFRVPYDPFIVLLAIFGYGFVWEQARERIRAWRAKRKAG